MNLNIFRLQMERTHLNLFLHLKILQKTQENYLL